MGLKTTNEQQQVKKLLAISTKSIENRRCLQLVLKNKEAARVSKKNQGDYRVIWLFKIFHSNNMLYFS